MKGFYIFAFVLLSFCLAAGHVQATITCSQTDSSKTIAVGETQPVTVQCSGIGSGETVTVSGSYSSSCMNAEDSTSFSLTQGSPSSQVNFQATSMSCQGDADDRKITWTFSHPTESISSTYTQVTITSPLSITASFKETPYTATAGSSTTVILEVSTSASTDITDVDAYMTSDISDITDWTGNTIYSSGSQKTIQKSWTFTAPSAGSYDISAYVTSQNADSDSASATLTVSSGGDGDDDNTGGTPGGTTGGTTGGALPPAASGDETIDVTLTAGEGVATNEKVASAVAALLEKELTENEKTSLQEISSEITSSTSGSRSFSASGGKSTITSTYTYSGQKKAVNFMLYESVPKSFASDASLVTVTASGGTVRVAEEDPSWVIMYPEVSPDQQLTVVYEVTGNKTSSVMDDMAAEVYAESLVDIVSEEPSGAGDDTTPGDQGTGVPQAPSAPPAGFDPLLMTGIIGAIAVIVIAGLVIKMKGGGRSTSSALEAVKSDLGQTSGKGKQNI